MIRSMNSPCAPEPLNLIEYWHQRLVETVESRGSLLHPEVLRVSQILDLCIVDAQRREPGFPA